MLSRESDRTIYFECDAKRCAQILETDTTDFEIALEKLKEANWATRHIKGEWVHVCPDCQEAESALAL
jgi:hypothetical protein